MEDKMVELTRFTLVSEAEILANLLKSEGVDCYVRDCFINQIYSGIDLGGVRVELLEKDLMRAKEVMQAFGYLGKEGKIEDAEKIEEEDEEEAEKIFVEYEQNKARLSRTMTIITLIVLFLLGSLILLNRFYNG